MRLAFDVGRNLILAGLPEKELQALVPHLHPVTLRSRQILYSSEQPVPYVYFPQGAVISLLKPLSSGKDVEISLVGDEGVAGLESILGAASSTHEAIVQVPGESLRVKPELLRQSFAHCGVLHDRLLRYTRYLLLQLSQTAACNRSHRLEERLARWILTVQDRAKRSVIPLTQEFLAQMLGSSRSEVTLAIGALRRARLLRYSRGKLTVVDRAGLEAIACECFHLIFEELENVEQEAAKARPPSRRFAPSPS